jgi:hypothetical protein
MSGQISKNITLFGNDYIVKFPNVGQLMDIESMKMALTNNNYSEWAFSGLKIHIFQLDIADAISYLSVLIPELKNDLGLKNWRELDALRSKKLVEEFKKSFIPWFKPLLDELTLPENEQSEQEQQDNNS